MVIDGKVLAKEVEQQIQQKLKKCSYDRKPKLVIMLIGENPDSLRYIKQKMKKCDAFGIEHELYQFSEDAALRDVEELLERVNGDGSVDGIIIQMPLPEKFVLNSKKLDVTRYLIDSVSPDKDIDGLTSTNIAKYVLGDESGFVPATPKGVMHILEAEKIPVAGKHVVVIGRSMIVGKPLAMLLLAQDAIVTMLHSKAESLERYTKEADIVISAVGKPGLIRSDIIKDKAVVIDVGISVNKENELAGDVDFVPVSQKAAYITPVPGGVGPLTVSYIIDNLVRAYCMHHEQTRE